MNVYVFEIIDNLTDSYHSGGGLVIVARDWAHVDEQIAVMNEKEATAETGYLKPAIKLLDEEKAAAIIYPTEATAEPRVVMMPNAGCC